MWAAALGTFVASVAVISYSLGSAHSANAFYATPAQTATRISNLVAPAAARHVTSARGAQGVLLRSGARPSFIGFLCSG